MNPRIHIPICSKEGNKSSTGEQHSRSTGPRYLLRSSTFPLCIVNIGGIYYGGETIPLMPVVPKGKSKSSQGRDTLLQLVLCKQYNFFSNTLPRTKKDTTTIPRI